MGLVSTGVRLVLVREWTCDDLPRDVWIVVISGCGNIRSVTFDGVEQIMGGPIPAEVFAPPAIVWWLGAVRAGTVMRVFADTPGDVLVVASG